MCRAFMVFVVLTYWYSVTASTWGYLLIGNLTCTPPLELPLLVAVHFHQALLCICVSACLVWIVLLFRSEVG